MFHCQSFRLNKKTSLCSMLKIMRDVDQEKKQFSRTNARSYTMHGLSYCVQYSGGKPRLIPAPGDGIPGFRKFRWTYGRGEPLKAKKL